MVASRMIWLIFSLVAVAQLWHTELLVASVVSLIPELPPLPQARQKHSCDLLTLPRLCVCKAQAGTSLQLLDACSGFFPSRGAPGWRQDCRKWQKKKGYGEAHSFAIPSSTPQEMLQGLMQEHWLQGSAHLLQSQALAVRCIALAMADSQVEAQQTTERVLAVASSRPLHFPFLQQEVLWGAR